MNDEGLVRRCNTKKVLALTGKAYPRVHLSKDGKKIKHSIHRLVGFTYHFEDYFPGYVINHKDGNIKNFHPSNIEWVTQSQNVKHSFEILGRRNSSAKYVLNTETGIFYTTIREASNTTNYSYQSIRHKLSGKWPNNTSLLII